MLANGEFVNSNRYMLNKSNEREKNREREREREREIERERVHNFCSITLFALREFYT